MVKASRQLLLHVSLLGLLALLVSGARQTLRLSYGLERRALEDKARKQRTSEVAASWNALRYSDIEGDTLEEEFVARVPWRSLNLSQIQEERLRCHLSELLSYLRCPTFEDYYRLKTEGLSWTFSPAGVSRARLTRNDDAENLGIPAMATHGSWQQTIRAAHGNEPARLTAVCLDEIAAATVSTNTATSLITGPVGKGMTVARAAEDPGFVYPDPSGTFAKTNSDHGLFVHLSFFARSSTSTNAGPVHLSLYWSEVDQNWAPSRMYTDVLLKMNVLF